MTLDTTLSKVQYQGNGVATVFPLPFKLLEDSHLKVVLTNAAGAGTPVAAGKYSITRSGSSTSVTYPLSGTPVPKGHRLTIYRYLPFDQVVDLVNAGAFHPRVIEEQGLDREEMQIQQLAEELGRSIKYPIDYEGDIPSAPEFIGNMEKLRDKSCECADRACACADQACECAEMSCECAERAEKAVAAMDDITVLKGGVSNLQETWATATAIASGSILTLPVGYFPGRNILRLTVDGLTCYPKGPNVPAALPQYEEMGAAGKLSREVKLLFAAPAGAVWNAWVIASNLVDLAKDFMERTEAAASKAEICKNDACSCAADALESKTAANNSKTAAANSAAEASAAQNKAKEAQQAAEQIKADVGAAKTATETAKALAVEAAEKAEHASQLAQTAQEEAAGSAETANSAKVVAESAINAVTTAKEQAQSAESNAQIAADKAAAAALAAQLAAGSVEAIEINASAPLQVNNTAGTITLSLNAASAATPGYVIQRDSNGRAQTAAPLATDDIARKAEVDAAIAQIPELSDSVSSASSIMAASSAAVKTAYDKATTAASTTATGAVRLATEEEAKAGLIDTAAVTPLRCKARTVLYSAANTRGAAIAANTNYTVPAYVVGNNSLQVCLDGIPCVCGNTAAQHQYKEIGTAGASSTTIQWHDAIAATYSITIIA